MADGSLDNGMPSLLMQAAQSAARADGLVPPSNGANASSNLQNSLAAAAAKQQQLQQARTMAAVQNARALQMQQQQQQQQQSSKKKGPPLRRGKWTPEEEAYANRLIQEFKAGLLPLTDGTTLRTFLSKLLNCDPMRISKKFVGSNCIGKQVFRRRTADMNRLTTEQIQKSRAELSELERRFLERVAQTNRVKSSGVGAGGGGHSANADASLLAGNAALQQSKALELLQEQTRMQQQRVNLAASNAEPPTPPWLQPPLGFKHGTGAAFAAANLSGANSRAAAAGRALLGGSALRSTASSSNNNGNNKLASASSSGLLAELQRRASQSSFLQNALQQHQQQQQQQNSASNLLAVAVRSGSGNALSGTGGSGLSMAQLARTASAARLGMGSGAGNSSFNELMLKTGLSREQLSQLARERSGLSSGSLSNMIQRQNSFDALMSLDFQSIQSIDNLANLIQNGGKKGHVPESGIQNADFGGSFAARAGNLGGLSGDAGSASQNPLGSTNRMESLLQGLSSNNLGRDGNAGASSTTNLSNLLQSMQGNLNNLGSSGAGGASAASLFGGNGGQSGVSLADLLRQDSSTGLTALRMQDGLNAQRNSSVDDFLSLVAAGDIPHQDPSLLDVPLLHQQQQQGSQQEAAAKLLAQQQLLQQSNPALANALASRSLGNLESHGLSANTLSALAGKRNLDDLGSLMDQQGDRKR